MGMTLNMDLDSGRIPGGSRLTEIISNGGNISEVRTNASLQKDEWKELDTAVVDVAQPRLRITGDIRSRGLVYNLSNALGTTVLETETASDMNDAEIDMMGKTKGTNDAQEFSIGYLPIPIIHKAFEINARKLAASRKLGQTIDTSQAALATRKVSEAIEKLLVVGTGGVTYGGGEIYGLENYTNNNTGSLTSGWENDSAREPITDALAMKQALIDASQYGPYSMIVPTAYETALDADYVSTTSTTITIRERLQKLEGIEKITVSDHATSTKVTMFQLDVNTIRLIVGQDPAPIEWSSGDKMSMYFKVMAIIVPQIRADADGNCGVVVYSE